MHSNLNTIQKLAEALAVRLRGYALNDAYTLSKEELYLHFKKGAEDFTCKMLIASHNCFLFFNDEALQKPSNAQPVFQSIFGQEIIGINTHKNRSFEMQFGNDFLLVFKMYNALANVILFHNNKVEDMFRDSIQNDFKLTPQSFYNTEAQPETTENTSFFSILKTSDKNLAYKFVYGKQENSLYETTDIIDALTQFARLNLSQIHFTKQKNAVLQHLKSELKKSKALETKCRQILETNTDELSAEETGHLIMANLHLLKQGDERALLFDFYHNCDAEIKLKKDLSPQENAAYYYRKSRNKKQETAQLQQNLEAASKRISQIENDIETVTNAEDIKLLKPFIKERVKQQDKLPFKVFHKDGFTIWVGKNAANNDLLTTQYAHKNDLWLHAKDVSGSHVVIKQQGQEFPQPVIEYAAGIAAHYSKLKGSALVPVTYTLKKYVRKPKGSEVGQVMVDREEVILVRPLEL